MSPHTLFLNRSTGRKKKTFYSLELVALENRVTPAAFTADVFLNNSVVDVVVTSTGVPNTLSLTNLDATTIEVDSGAGNTITLTDRTGGNLTITNLGQASNIGLNAIQAAGLKLTGSAGDDQFTLNSFDSTVLQSAFSFGFQVDTSTNPGGLADTLTINNAVILKGAGSFITSNDLDPTKDLTNITVTATGSISTAGTGAILLVANSQIGSNVTIDSGGTVNTQGGSITLVAENTANPTGRIQLNGNAINTQGGFVSLQSPVQLQKSSTINTGSGILGSITFTGKLDGTTANIEDMTLISEGAISFNDDIGFVTPLGKVSTQTRSPASLTMSGTNGISADSLQNITAVTGPILITGPQTYANNAGLNLNATGDIGAIQLLGNISLQANATLQLAHSGLLTIGGSITNGILNEIGAASGTSVPQVTLGVNNPVTLTMNTGITFNSPVFLGQNATLVTGNGQGILFNNTVNGARILTLNTVSTVEFKANVGDTSTVDQIVTLGNNPSALTFVGGGALQAGGVTATVNGAVTITVDQNYTGIGLNLTTIGKAGTVTLGKITSQSGSIAGVTINNGVNTAGAGAILTLTKDLALDGAFSQVGDNQVNIGDNTSAATINITTNNQDVSFSGAVVLVKNLNINAGTFTTSDVVFNGSLDSLSGVANNLTVLAGGRMQFLGSVGAVTPLGVIDSTLATLSTLIADTPSKIIQTGSLAAKVAGTISLLVDQTYSTAAGLVLSTVNPGNSISLGNITTVNGGVVQVANTGTATLAGNIIASGSVSFTGTGSLVFGSPNITSLTVRSETGNIFFNGAVTLGIDTQIATQGGTITFNNLVDGDFSLGMTSQTGNILLSDRVGVNPLGPITIDIAGGVTILGNVFAESLKMTNISGPVVFSGTLQFNNISGNSLDVQTNSPLASVLLQSQVFAPFGVNIQNTATLTITDQADIVITSGNFVQAGGTVDVAGDILTPAGTITLNGAVNLTGVNNLVSGSTTIPGSILFSSTLNGPGNTSLSSSGTITVLGAVGNISRVGTLRIVNSINNAFGGIATLFNSTSNIVTLEVQSSVGEIRFNGKTIIESALLTAPGIYGFNFNGASTTIGGTANFTNTGATSLNSFSSAATTTFTANASFNTAGVLNIQGNIFVAGNFSCQRAVSIIGPTSLNLNTQLNRISGALTGTSTLTLGSAGSMVLAADSPAFGGILQLNNGTLQMSANYNSATVNLAGGTLTGNGQVSQVLGSKGTLAPGATLGTLTLANQLVLGPGNFFDSNINGASAGSFGQVRVLGGLTNLGQAVLRIPQATNLSQGQTVTLIDNSGASPGVLNQFAGLSEGASIPVGNTTFTISYKGGNGNDVVLKVQSVVAPPAPPTGGGTPSGISKFFALGTDAGGGPVVTVNYVNGKNIAFYAYDPGYTGGVRVALGDMNGDGIDDLITGTGIGGGPHIKVFDVSVGTPVTIASFFAFEPNFMGGTNLATGDINGDGLTDIIIGAGPGGGPRVKVISGQASKVIVPTAVINDFFAYAAFFSGGVTVAAGDRNGDGIDDVITGAGIGGGPNVRSFSGAGLLIDNFFAFSSSIINGIFVAAGNVDNDSSADIIVGTGLGTPTLTAAFFSNGSSLTARPFPTGFQGGARVGIMQNSDGREVFAVAAGPGGGPLVQALNNSLAVTDSAFMVNPLFSGGLFMNTTI
ncbi:MAG: hypothetical protein EXR99_06205 [Gemmataceae bacterium]|nr:hypothetical protein [Gemmataceae bacterium]